MIRVLLALALVCGACAPPELVVGSDLDNPPFASLDGHGEPAGRDVAMMELIAAGLGRRLVWRRMPFPELLDAAAEGRVDVVCATLGITPERAERVRFTAPYFETSLAVVVRQGEGEPGALDDLAGRRVGAGAGTTSERAVLARPEWDLVRAGEGASGGALVATGEADAWVVDAPDVPEILERHPGLRRLAAPLASERYALALPPTRGKLADEIDRVLTVLRTRGELRRLDREWGLVDAR